MHSPRSSQDQTKILRLYRLCLTNGGLDHGLVTEWHKRIEVWKTRQANERTENIED